MQETLRRTPRPLSSIPPRGTAHRNRLAWPGASVHALLLLGVLAALGWRAQHPTTVPRVQIMVEPAAATRPSGNAPAGSALRAIVRPAIHRARAHSLSTPIRRAVRVATARHHGARVDHTRAAQRSPATHAVSARWTRPTRIRRPVPSGLPLVQALSPARRSSVVLRPSPGARITLPPVSAAGDLERQALAANPGARIMALPSVSVTAIRQELRRGGSPLPQATWADGKDAAQYIWDAGRVLGVDPAVLMAFFWHESQYGVKGMARLTFSVGNIRPLDGQPQLNGYRFYRTWQQSVDDTYRLLRNYARHGLADVASAVPVWAPSTDNNDVRAYTTDVEATMAHYYTLSVAGDGTAATGVQMIASGR